MVVVIFDKDDVLLVFLIIGSVFELLVSCEVVCEYGVKLIVIIVFGLVLVKMVDVLLFIKMLEIDLIFKLFLLCYVMMVMLDMLVLELVLLYKESS